MKAIAFNSSPRMSKSNTSLILNPFIDGMKEAGAEVELIYTRKLNIKACIGCFNCWLRTPDECSQKDDMQGLIPKIRESEIRVYASPIYCYTINAELKNLMDRQVAMASPFVEIAEGRTRHLPAEGEKPYKAVFVSNCGLWDMYNFEIPVAHMEMLFRDPPAEFAGALLRPHGQALREMLKMKAPVDDVIDAAHEAGRQLVSEGIISETLLKTISRPLIEMDAYVELVNEMFQQVMDKQKRKI